MDTEILKYVMADTASGAVLRAYYVRLLNRTGLLRGKQERRCG